MQKLNVRLMLSTAVLMICSAMILNSCKTKKISANSLDKFMVMENPYLESNRSNSDRLGFGDAEGGLKDTIVMCYEMLDEKDRDLRPIIASLVEQNPDNEEILFISGKNHMNLENYARALEVFSTLKGSENYNIMDQARYYFCLISVYLDKTDQSAISLLEEITKDNKSKFSDLAEDVISFL